MTITIKSGQASGLYRILDITAKIQEIYEAAAKEINPKGDLDVEPYEAYPDDGWPKEMTRAEFQALVQSAKLAGHKAVIQASYKKGRRTVCEEENPKPIELNDAEIVSLRKGELHALRLRVYNQGMRDAAKQRGVELPTPEESRGRKPYQITKKG